MTEQKKIFFKDGSKGFAIITELKKQGIKVNGLADSLLEEAQKD